MLLFNTIIILIITLYFRRNTITNTIDLTVDVVARLAIINAIAVADIEAELAAVSPDRVLNEPGEGLGERWVELPGIDLVGNGLNDLSTAALLITGRPIGMDGIEALQDPGPVQKVVHQRIDGDHAGADLVPERPVFGGAQ
jgi:hypothetical protein